MYRTPHLSAGYRIALFGPPYERFEPIDTTWTPPPLPPQGLALVWWLIDGEEQKDEFGWLSARPWGLPLFIILPPATEISRALPLLSHINGLSPRAVLPGGPLVTPHHLRRLLRMPPRQIGAAVTSYLTRRQLLVQDDMRRGVRKIFEAIPEATSVSKLARRLYTSRRTMGRHFAAAGLPVPSHWLQFARLLLASFHLQDDKHSVARIATRLGYPDGFTLSNQMKRLIDCRPSDVRHRLGWEWIVEMWIRTETNNGGIDRLRFREVVAIYHKGEEPPPN
jgi:AraC-like DNA-binding protein